MSARIETFRSLAERVLSTPPVAPTRIVAVDGHGGSGKTTFATRLAHAFNEVVVVHTDDFASWDNPVDWWPRLDEQVLQPLLAGRPARYQRYDWTERRLAEWHEIPLPQVLLIEGVSAARQEISQHLTLSVWLEAPRDVCFARGLARDGDHLHDAWVDWLHAEDEHFRVDRTRERADIVADGAPHIDHDPDLSYVRLT